ncbi:phosphotriesterase family protein [Pseudonocardia sp. GCM10023141]|uniref:phosphotriesterase family protein n=1 Tax=Pseudonocardia sp. GCM10023141 TaxID=3252653 RepID=UPI003606EBC3
MTAARTVLGDVPVAELGTIDAHDHLFLRSALLPGQELDDVAAAIAEARRFRGEGGATIVQWTPFGLGRRVDALPEVSRASGVHIIAATGLHQRAHLGERPVPDRLADLFTAELTTGIHGGPVRAGMIKVAGGFHGIDDHARLTMEAAAEAHHRTGAPIGVHLEHGTAVLDVVGLLCHELRVPPARLVLGHLNRSPDLYPIRAAADAGAFLAFDGPSRANHATDWRLFDLLADVVEHGHAGQVLLGGDTTTAVARSTCGGPGMPFLLTALRPRLAETLGADVAAAVFVDNPARAFGVDWR